MHSVSHAPSTALALHHLRNVEDRRRAEQRRTARRTRVTSMPVTDPHEPTPRRRLRWLQSESVPAVS